MVFYLPNNHETSTIIGKLSLQVFINGHFIAYLNAEIIFIIALCTTSLGERSRGPTATSSSC